MIVVALDCSLDACSAAIYDSDRAEVLSQNFAAMTRGQAEAIAPMAREVVTEAKLTMDAIDRIAVTLGPGTFTGIRIGLAFAKGLGLTLNRPVIGIDSLRAIAANAAAVTTAIAVVNDARQGQVYFALLKNGVTVLAPQRVTLAEAIALLPSGAVAIMGTLKHAIVAEAARRDVTMLEAGDIPVAANFAPLAISEPPASAPLRPLYLAQSYAKLPKHKGAPPLDIKIAHGQETSTLASLHAACFERGWSASEMARLLAMPGAVCLIARRDDQPLAFLLLRSAGDEAEIITIGTLPDMRRQGIGAALIAAALPLLRSHDIQRLLIEVAASNAPALALYRKVGFSAVGQRRDYYQHANGRREDAIIMSKTVSA
jgi:tRNA threonylcarbamoyl adenosine modification protein YeaZ/ribosomal-protein-alanine acetyltransferase